MFFMIGITNGKKDLEHSQTEICDVCGRPIMNGHVIDERLHVVKHEDREASKLKCIDLCDECFAAIKPKVVADK